MKIKTADLTATGHDYLAWAAQALSRPHRPLTELSAAAAPPYESGQQEKMGVLTIHLPMRKKTAYVKAAQAKNQKLAAWVLEQLDAAAGKR